MNDAQIKAIANVTKPVDTKYSSVSMKDTQLKIPINISKIGAAKFPVALFDAPEVGQVVSARLSARRNPEGNVIEGSVEKLIFDVVNYKVLQMILKNGGSQSDLATITLDYVADEAVMKEYKVEDLIGKILDLRQVEVGLKWVQRGASGSWGGFKLICSTLKFVQLPTNKATE